MADEKINKEAMYRVFRSFWFTKEQVNFAALNEEVFLVKFGRLEDRERIQNMAPWLFDKCLISLVPFEKNKGPLEYKFPMVPFWIRILNVPLENMNRQVALEIVRAVGEVIAIDRKDREGCWTKFMRVRIWLDTTKPLRRVVYMVNKEGDETLCYIQYERLPYFCFVCGIIGHKTQKCVK